MIQTSETIKVLGANDKWKPHLGSETIALLKRLDVSDESRARISNEVTAILSQCPPVTANTGETGLVIGYVQSGKTNSLTVLTALASDNGYRMVIVLTGVTTLLDDQSAGRLRKELRLSDRTDRKWLHFENPKLRPPQVVNGIRNALSLWDDAEIPDDEKRTVLITVMKQHRHLQNLCQVLKNLDLTKCPVLVIDDEADQASLNNMVASGLESTTYTRILEIKSCLPHHHYVQYTATPQAPLLINMIDVLSPKFAELLEPGADYAGGQTFFGSSGSPLVRVIPDAHVPTGRNTVAEVPESLQEALRIFFLGVASARVQGKSNDGNRSMMVHPSQSRAVHNQYHHWVTQITRRWVQQLADADRDTEILLREFEQSYSDLARTVPDLPAFETLAEKLSLSIRTTDIVLLNASSGHTPTIDWNSHYSFILVGGPALDRGFTVRGLTVSYMPRSVGVGNADTVQQRARFFGYKRGYLGYCRVYLQNAVLDVFRSYVEHEEDVRGRLLVHRDSGKRLTEWKRAFFLDTTLRPTRDSVLSLDYIRDNVYEEWFWPASPHEGGVAGHNLEVVNSLRNRLTWTEYPGDARRTEFRTHRLAANVSLHQVYDELLVDWKTARLADSQKFTGILLQIERYLRNNRHAACSVIEMSQWSLRNRDYSGGEIRALLSGSQSSTGYRGDSSVRGANGLTVQLHRLRLTSGTTVIAEDVPLIALYIPRQMSADWWSQ